MARHKEPLTKEQRKALQLPFESDGCTSWPDGPWRACCEAHDRCYRYGAIWGMSRLRADRELQKCIAAKGYVIMSWVMFWGVRRFGGRHWQKQQTTTIV